MKLVGSMSGGNGGLREKVDEKRNVTILQNFKKKEKKCKRKRKENRTEMEGIRITESRGIKANVPNDR